jgi:hypothetical protein
VGLAYPKEKKASFRDLCPVFREQFLAGLDKLFSAGASMSASTQSPEYPDIEKMECRQS